MPELITQAPEGSHFEFDSVATEKGSKSLGEWPILVWDDIQAVIDTYGEQGLRDILDGTSVRVSFQSIARRGAIAGKTMDEVATMQVAFRPGKRAGGASTPVSRAKNASGKAAEKLGDQADKITALLERIARGEVTAEQLDAMI